MKMEMEMERKESCDALGIMYIIIENFFHRFYILGETVLFTTQFFYTSYAYGLSLERGLELNIL